MASIGPRLPPGFVPKDHSDDSSESESDEDLIGPLPPPADGSGPSLSLSAAQDFERRQLAMKRRLEDEQVNYTLTKKF